MAHISYQPTGMWAYLYLTSLVMLQVTLPWEQDIRGALALPPFAPHSQSTLGGMLTGKAER